MHTPDSTTLPLSVGRARRSVWLALLWPLLLVAACGEEPTTPETVPVEDKGFDRVALTYPSSVLGKDRPLVVLLPPDYDELEGDLPVLYLLHGWGGDEGDWTNIGFASSLLGHYYADGTIDAMIVVMPDNVLGESSLAYGPETDPFLNEIREDIIPFVESHYRASGERRDRAIAGLSAGGIQTLNLTLFYPELWSYSYPMSASYFSDTFCQLRAEYGEDLANPAINELVEFELQIGTEDPLFYVDAQAMRGVFDEFGIQYTYYEAPGGHTWEFWRSCLARIAPVIFRQ